MRKANYAAIKIIKKYEGFSHKAYICPAGYQTIGYGHRVRNGENFAYISEEDAEDLLKDDLSQAENAVNHYIRKDISENEFSALVSLTYNIGPGSLQRSSLRQKINYISDSEEINMEFMKWVRIKGKICRGLVIRRQAEMMLFNSTNSHFI